jgi:hypothetical protein
MFHIILTSETLLMNQHPLQYTAAAISVITAVFAVPSATIIIITTTAVSIVTAVSECSRDTGYNAIPNNYTR